MECDPEIKGEGNSYTTEFRQYDPRIGRWLSIDPKMNKYPHFSPYIAMDNNPIYLTDIKGDDAVVGIRGNKITISAQIYLWGSGATKEVAEQMQKDIMNAWGAKKDGNKWTYKDPESGKTYTVKFDVKVKLYQGKEKNMNEPDHENKEANENFFKVSKTVSGDNRSYVIDGHYGELRGQGRSGLSLAEDDPAPHEFGHMLGIPDLYKEGGGYKKAGYKGNIMAEPAMQGIVWQGNIDRILKAPVEAFNKLKEDGFKKSVRKGEKAFFFKIGRH
jgi:RHS repeat-associated protein